jgi:hypothetical protein
MPIAPFLRQPSQTLLAQPGHSKGKKAMATIRKRGDRWHVQVRRKGCASATRSFLKRADAETWARQTELDADRHGLPLDRKALERVTVADVFTRYRDEVVPRKRGRVNETLAINAFLRHRIANIRLNELTPAHVSAYRDERLKAVKPTTLNRQLDIFRHALEVATREWAMPLNVNPFAMVTRPMAIDARERRLKPGELDRLATPTPPPGLTRRSEADRGFSMSLTR